MDGPLDMYDGTAYAQQRMKDAFRPDEVGALAQKLFEGDGMYYAIMASVGAAGSIAGALWGYNSASYSAVERFIKQRTEWAEKKAGGNAKGTRRGTTAFQEGKRKNDLPDCYKVNARRRRDYWDGKRKDIDYNADLGNPAGWALGFVIFLGISYALIGGAFTMCRELNHDVDAVYYNHGCFDMGRTMFYFLLVSSTCGTMLGIGHGIAALRRYDYNSLEATIERSKREAITTYKMHKDGKFVVGTDGQYVKNHHAQPADNWKQNPYYVKSGKKPGETLTDSDVARMLSSSRRRMNGTCRRLARLCEAIKANEQKRKQN